MQEVFARPVRRSEGPEIYASATRPIGDYSIRMIIVQSPATNLRKAGEHVRVVTRQLLAAPRTGEELVLLDDCGRLPLAVTFDRFILNFPAYLPQDDHENRALFEAVVLPLPVTAVA